MAYTKHNWQDYEAGGTLVTAQKLNEMEDGIETANEMLHVDVDEELSETSDNPVANNVIARTFRRLTESVNSIIQNAVTVVDTSLSTTSTNPVQNKVVTAAISQAGGGFRVEIVSTLPATGQNGVMYLLAVEQTETGNLYDEYLWIESQSRFERVGSRISIDDALSSTSENPVQNKVVKSALDGKQDYIAPVVIAQDGTKSLVVNGNLATSANVNVMNGNNTVALQSSSLSNIIFTDGTTANRYSVQDLVDREGGVQSDWDEDDEESLAYIKNKPDITDSDAEYDALNTNWLGYRIPKGVFSVENLSELNNTSFWRKINRVALYTLEWKKHSTLNGYYANPYKMLENNREMYSTSPFYIHLIDGYWSWDNFNSYPAGAMGTDGNGTIYWKAANEVTTVDGCKKNFKNLDAYLYYRTSQTMFTSQGHEATSNMLVTEEEFLSDKYYKAGEYCKYENELYLRDTDGITNYAFPIKSNGWTKTSVAQRLTEIANDALNLKMLGWTVPSECPIQNSISGNVFTQKVGRVDLGSLSWSDSGTNDSSCRRMKTTLTGAKTPSSTGNKANIYCYKYATETATNTYLRVSGIAIDTSSSLLVYDTNYNTSSSVSAFKTAMNGVYLYYELATPITMTVDGNEATNNSLITDQYSATKQYSVGDYCIYNNTLYKCKVTATGQLPTNTTYWSATSVGGELGSVNNNLDRNNYGIVVSITNTEESNPYICPCDGYVRAYSYAVDTDACAKIYDANMSNYIEIHARKVNGNSGNREMNSVFVRKGMKVLNANAGSSGVVSFFGLT